MPTAKQAEQIRKLKTDIKVLSQIVLALLELLPDKHPGKKLERTLVSAGFLPTQARRTD